MTASVIVRRHHDTLQIVAGDVVVSVAGCQETALAEAVERIAWDHERREQAIEIDDDGKQHAK